MRKKYLVPLDGSELAEHALPWAKTLATKKNAQVELIRCYEPLASVYMLPEFAAPAPVYYDQSAFHEQIDEYLESQADTFPKGQAITTRCEGDAGMAILDRSESDEVEAIIMASHGRGGIGRWLLGSVATKVLRGSKVPVLVINATTKVPPKPELKKLLVPLDGSETAEAALPKAIELAKSFDAEVTIYQGVPHKPIGNPNVDQAVSYELETAQEYLDKVKERFPGVQIATAAKVAGPNLGIAEEAENHDLVVMSSHGRSGVKRWLLGSVAENVLQAVHKPLFIVYQRDHAED